MYRNPRGLLNEKFMCIPFVNATSCKFNFPSVFSVQIFQPRFRRLPFSIVAKDPVRVNDHSRILTIQDWNHSVVDLFVLLIPYP